MKFRIALPVWLFVTTFASLTAAPDRQNVPASEAPAEPGTVMSLEELDRQPVYINAQDALSEPTKVIWLNLEARARFEPGRIAGSHWRTGGRSSLKALGENLRRFSNLQVLDVEANDVAALASHLPHLRKLQRLNVSYTGAEHFDAIVQALAQLEHFKSLSAMGCGIPRIPPALTSIKGLLDLNLYNNKIQALPANLFGLTRLRGLNVYANPLAGPWPVGVSQLRNLQSLEISAGDMGPIPGELFSLTALKHLNLSGTDLSRVADRLGSLPQLERLELASTCAA